MYSLITNDLKGTMNSILIICHCLIYQNLYEESLRLTNIVTIVLKLINFITSEGMNHQFKDFLNEWN
jgi:hypothetical protein